MKKQLILGMAMAVLASSAMAAGPKMTEAQLGARSVERAKAATQPGSLHGVDYTNETKKRSDIAEALAKNNTLDVDSLIRAQGTTLTVDVNGKKESVSVGELAQRAQMINQEVSAIKEARTELDPTATAKLAAQEKGVKLAAQILSMTIANASGVKPGSARTIDMIKRDSAGHDKFAVEYINTLESGSAIEIDSYNTLAKAILDARISPTVTKDEAFDQGMSKIYGAKAEEKKKEMEGCVRG